MLQSSIETLKKNSNDTKSILDQHVSILDKLGVAQHHDSITGTSRARVSEDYYKMVAKAADEITALNLQLLKKDI